MTGATVIVLSPKYLPELKKLPDHTVSMDEAVNEVIDNFTIFTTTALTKLSRRSKPSIPRSSQQYPSFRTRSKRILHLLLVSTSILPKYLCCVRRLTRWDAARLNGLIAQECRECLAINLPESPDWTPINIHHKLLRIVGMVSGRMFIGPELSRTEEYLDAAINYTMEVMTAQRAVVNMNPWLRPFLASRLPEIKKLEKRKREAYNFLMPVIEARKQAFQDSKDDGPDDMLQWLIRNSPKFTDAHSQNLAEVQLGLSFAAIHTTVLVTTNV